MPPGGVMLTAMRAGLGVPHHPEMPFVANEASPHPMRHVLSDAFTWITPDSGGSGVIAGRHVNPLVDASHGYEQRNAA